VQNLKKKGGKTDIHYRRTYSSIKTPIFWKTDCGLLWKLDSSNSTVLNGNRPRSPMALRFSRIELYTIIRHIQDFVSPPFIFDYFLFKRVKRRMGNWSRRSTTRKLQRIPILN